MLKWNCKVQKVVKNMYFFSVLKSRRIFYLQKSLLRNCSANIQSIINKNVSITRLHAYLHRFTMLLNRLQYIKKIVNHSKYLNI